MSTQKPKSEAEKLKDQLLIEKDKRIKDLEQIIRLKNDIITFQKEIIKAKSA